MPLLPFPSHVIELLGVVGFGLYVLNYTLLTFRRISGDCLTYFAINFSAASLVLIGLTTSFNLAAALVQVFWICMSTLAIILRLARARGYT